MEESTSKRHPSVKNCQNPSSEISKAYVNCNARLPSRKVKSIITTKVSQEDDNCQKPSSLLSLLKIIVSPKTKEQQEEELVQCINNNPELLTTILRHSLNDAGKKAEKKFVSEEKKSVSNTESTECPSGRHTDNPRVKKKANVKSEGKDEIHYKSSLDESNKSSKVPWRRKDGDNLKINRFAKTGPLNRSNLGNLKSKNKRKYKQDCDRSNEDFEENASLRREPKRRKKGKSQQKQNISEQTASATTVDVDDNIGQPKSTDISTIARKLLTLLKYPRSLEQHQAILDILKSDQNLLQTFLKERKKFGPQKVAIFVPKQSSENEKEKTRGTPLSTNVSQKSHTSLKQSDRSEWHEENTLNAYSDILDSTKEQSTSDSKELHKILRSLILHYIQSKKGLGSSNRNEETNSVSSRSSPNSSVINLKYSGTSLSDNCENDLRISVSPSYCYPSCSTSNQTDAILFEPMSVKPVPVINERCFQTPAAGNYHNNEMFDNSMRNVISTISEAESMLIGSPVSCCSNMVENNGQMITPASFTGQKPLIQQHFQQLPTPSNSQLPLERHYSQYDTNEEPGQSLQFGGIDVESNINTYSFERNARTIAFTSDMICSDSHETSFDEKNENNVIKEINITENECTNSIENLKFQTDGGNLHALLEVISQMKSN